MPGSAAACPPELVHVAGQNSIQGYNLASLLVYPLQCSPQRKTLKLRGKLSLDFALEPVDLDYLPMGKRSKAERAAIKDDVRSVVVNPDNVSRFAPPVKQQRGRPARPPGGSGQPSDSDEPCVRAGRRMADGGDARLWRPFVMPRDLRCSA